MASTLSSLLSVWPFLTLGSVCGSDTFIGFLPGFFVSCPAADVYTHITNRSPAPHFNEPSGFVEENMRGSRLWENTLRWWETETERRGKLTLLQYWCRGTPLIGFKIYNDSQSEALFEWLWPIRGWDSKHSFAKQTMHIRNCWPRKWGAGAYTRAATIRVQGPRYHSRLIREMAPHFGDTGEENQSRGKSPDIWWCDPDTRPGPGPHQPVISI